MGELLIRRREMILPSAAPSEWDYEWYYTDGIPSADDGWTKIGADTPTITASGMKVNRSYFDKDVEITHGVIEAKFTASSFRTTSNTTRALLRIGDADNSIYVVFRRYSGNNIRLWTASSINNGQIIGSFTFGSPYIVRITINGAVGTVEVNDEVIADEIDTTAMHNRGAIRFGCNEQYGQSVWEYVKYKSLA